jgi:hypothetical protein
VELRTGGSDMAQTPASQQELKNSFKKHYHVYNTIDTSFHPMTRRLLLFYVVESGLKCYLLKKIHKNRTDELYSHREYMELKEHGHDLRRLVKLAGIGGQGAYQLKRLVRSNEQTVEPEQFHQLWRYGIKTKTSESEEQAETVLQNIVAWLNNNLN